MIEQYLRSTSVKQLWLSSVLPTKAEAGFILQARARCDKVSHVCEVEGENIGQWAGDDGEDDVRLVCTCIDFTPANESGQSE
jgi:hypothetical protein